MRDNAYNANIMRRKTPYWVSENLSYIIFKLKCINYFYFYLNFRLYDNFCILAIAPLIIFQTD